MSSLVSVVVPVYNRERYITECVQSVINQTYKNWELLLVDDGSTDNSLQLAQDFAQDDTRIKSIQRNREPKGAPTCRNIGIEKANGDFIVFLDSDDLMAPFCIEQRVSEISSVRGVDFITFPTLIFKTSINEANRLVNIQTSEPELYRFLRSDVVWCTPSAIWKRKSIQQLSGFDEGLSNNQDQELYLRTLLSGLSYKSCLDHRPDNYYRSHDGERIYSKENELKTLKGVHYLLMKLSRKFGSQIKTENKSKENLKIFFTHSVRRLTQLNEQAFSKSLIYEYNKSGLINRVSFMTLLLYVQLSAFKLNKIRGYERLWNVFLGPFALKKEWGRHKYSQ